MDNVTDPEAVITQPQGEQTPAPNASDANPTPSAPATPAPKAEEPATQAKPTGDLSVALKQERERRKAIERELAQMRGSKQIEGYDQEDLQTVTNHPFVKDLLYKQAETTLRDGVKDMLEQYPNIPKSVAKAILRNPRGYVNPGTTDVQNGLIDIQDYLEEIAAEFETPPATPEPQPKTVTVMGNNKGINQNLADADIKAILDIPSEEWTPEQNKAVDTFYKNNK